MDRQLGFTPVNGETRTLSVQGMMSTVRRLLGLPDGLRFQRLHSSWHVVGDLWVLNGDIGSCVF